MAKFHYGTVNSTSVFYIKLSSAFHTKSFHMQWLSTHTHTHTIHTIFILKTETSGVLMTFWKVTFSSVISYLYVPPHPAGVTFQAAAPSVCCWHPAIPADWKPAGHLPTKSGQGLGGIGGIVETESEMESSKDWDSLDGWGKFRTLVSTPRSSPCAILICTDG